MAFARRRNAALAAWAGECMSRNSLLDRSLIALLLALFVTPQTHAGIHLPLESWNDLPSQWRGFLLDHRKLLGVLATPAGQKPSSASLQYRRMLEQLRESRKKRPLSPDETADLGGLLLRVGENHAALQVLQAAQREHPHHYRLTAHLAMAWLALNQPAQALVLQKEVVRLAPGRWLAAEETLAQLMQSRARNSNQGLDELFGKPLDGLIDAIRQAKPWDGKGAFPSDTLARIQTLALWLPGDGRVIAQTGVLCAAFGDTKQAAMILEGAVTEFGIRDPLVMRLRQVCKDAKPIDHGKHPGVKFRSARPFEDLSELAGLPPIEPGKITEVPWIVFSKTKLAVGRKPEFIGYLKQLDGREIRMEGYLQPFGENLDEGRFLLVENAVGCWWCDMPDLTGMIRIDLAENHILPSLRRLVRVKGKLQLNSQNPEAHLFALEDAEVKPAE